VGRFGQQPAREVLQTDARGPETANHRRAELGAACERNDQGAARGLKEDSDYVLDQSHDKVH
jgi:hypothetical protein